MRNKWKRHLKVSRETWHIVVASIPTIIMFAVCMVPHWFDTPGTIPEFMLFFYGWTVGFVFWLIATEMDNQHWDRKLSYRRMYWSGRIDNNYVNNLKRFYQRLSEGEKM